MGRTMRKPLIYAAAAAAAAIPFTAIAATGTPQRGDETPPGLAKKPADPPPGFFVALAATVGSNSRLQDLPVSP